MTYKTLNLSDDIIDVRDIIERVEELEGEIESIDDMPDGDQLKNTIEGEEMREELAALMSILDSLKGYGGDEQWRGDWYPLTLIAESYFTEYTEELISDCYDLKLPDFVHVDWEATAREIKVDYSQEEINGSTYFYR